MKASSSVFQCVCMIVFGVFLAATSANAEEVSAITNLAQPKFEIGKEFQVDANVALHGALSIGGYLYLTHDPVFECVKVATQGMFGAAQEQACLYARPGVLRIEATVKTFADAVAYTDTRTFATVTFRANATTAAAAIRLSDPSQLFGAGLGNILTAFDDRATQQIKIFKLLAVTLNLPDPGQALAGIYTIEWLIRNTVSLPIELTLEITENQGVNWQTLFSQAIEPNGKFQWDTSGLANGDYLMRASIKNFGSEDFTAQAGTFVVWNRPPEPPQPPDQSGVPGGVPEPSTLVLMILGLGGIIGWSLKRSRK